VTDRQLDTGRQQRPRLRIASRGKNDDGDANDDYNDVPFDMKMNIAKSDLVMKNLCPLVTLFQHTFTVGPILAYQKCRPNSCF